jgi:peroxiredoxin
MTAAVLPGPLVLEPPSSAAEHPTLPIGAAAPPFEGLLGTDGRRYGFSTFEGREALVVIFSSNRCPTAKAYGSRMNALQADYAAEGVQVVAINSNSPHLYPDESFAAMVDRAAEDGYLFPYLVDEGQRVAKAWGPTCTFHVFLLDRDRRVRYEGRFDDARLPERVTSNDLRNALDDVLAGREVTVPKTRPFGCGLDLV